METLKIQASKPSVGAVVWTGRILGWLIILFLLVDAIMKIVMASVSVQGTTQLGFSINAVQPIGALLLVITVLYSIPRTAILGAIFLTAYFGAAVATMLFNNISMVFPIAFCTLAWVSLYLRDPRVRALFAPRQEG